MEQYCPLCERQCSQTKPECEHGEKYFIYGGMQQESQEERLIALFYKCSHLFVHRSGKDQAKNRILVILLKHGDMTQRELLNHTDIRSASLSELLSKIEANGDIKRERSKENACNVNVCLTDKGREEAKEIQKQQLEFAKQLFSPLDQEEQKQFEKLLAKLLVEWKSESRGKRD